nr:MAG TPA: hypothetical protein [Caudoviricetes sp.]
MRQPRGKAQAVPVDTTDGIHILVRCMPYQFHGIESMNTS